MTDIKGYLFQAGYSGVTYTDIANLTGRTLTTTEQNLLTSLITQAEDYLARQCGRNFYYTTGSADQTYIETFDAGKYKYFPINVPIKIVTQISLDGTALYKSDGSVQTLKLGTDFFVYPDHIEFLTPQHSVNNDKQSLSVIYTMDKFWGDDVKNTIIRWVTEIFLGKEYGGKPLTNLNAGGLSISLDRSNLPDFVEEVIEYYRRYKI